MQIISITVGRRNDIHSWSYNIWFDTAIKGWAYATEIRLYAVYTKVITIYSSCVARNSSNVSRSTYGNYPFCRSREIYAMRLLKIA
jgi:hypothetical protein